MPLSEKQRELLTAEAQKRGVDPAALIREAEKLVDGKTDEESAKGKAPGASVKGEKPNLYMYHLPFVTVNEVRTNWLGLEPWPDGNEPAAAFAARQTVGPAKPDPEGAA